MRYLPIEINEKEHKAIPKMNHAIACVSLQLAAIVNLCGIVNSHIATGDTKILVKQPDRHWYVHQR